MCWNLRIWSHFVVHLKSECWSQTKAAQQSVTNFKDLIVTNLVTPKAETKLGLRGRGWIIEPLKSDLSNTTKCDQIYKFTSTAQLLRDPGLVGSFWGVFDAHPVTFFIFLLCICYLYSTKAITHTSKPSTMFSGTTNWRGRFSIVDLLIKVACFVKN